MPVQQQNLSIEWLNSIFSSTGSVAPVTDFTIEDVGAGTGFGATVLRLHLKHSAPGKLPDSVIVKLPPTDPETLVAIEQQGLTREARFYADLAPTAGIGTPDVLHVSYEDSDFTIVMSDLGDIKSSTGLLTSMPEREIKRAILAAAKLHAGYWNHPVLMEPWLTPVTDSSQQTLESHRARLRQAIAWLSQSSHDCDYTLDCARRLERLAASAPTRTPLPRPLTLVHGDFHLNNLHVDSKGVVTLFDWQLVARGTPAMDLANLLATSLDAGEFDRLRLPLMKTYHEGLLANGVRDYSWRQFSRGFGDAMFITFLKFLVVLGTINYEVEDGDEIREDMIERLNALAIRSNALTYCRLMPVIIPLMKLINLRSESQQ